MAAKSPEPSDADKQIRYLAAALKAPRIVETAGGLADQARDIFRRFPCRRGRASLCPEGAAPMPIRLSTMTAAQTRVTWLPIRTRCCDARRLRQSRLQVSVHVEPALQDRPVLGKSSARPDAAGCGLMCANMLRPFQLGKARASQEGPSRRMRESRVASAHETWPACHFTKASASAVM